MSNVASRTDTTSPRDHWVQLRDQYRDGLLGDVIPFWMRHGVDREYGGFCTCLDQDGTLLDTDKGIWQQGRMAWLFGELFNTVEPRKEWLELCRQGLDFLDRHGYDPADGRMWFHVTREGEPIRKRRDAFSESFAAIAYGELAKATSSALAAENAERAFLRFVDHNLNPRGVQPKFTTTRPMQSLGFPMITIVTAQQLRDSIGLKSADDWIDRSLDTICSDFIKEDLQCVMETVGPKGEVHDHFDGRTLNPGHAIEAAWFLMREGEHRRDRELVSLGCRMLDWMWLRGWDSEQGGLLYFVDLHGGPVQEYWHDMKFWWPQNEVIIATLLAYALTGEDKYARWHQQAHDWAYAHFPDPGQGEWFGYLHRDGRRSNSLKGSLWKGAFHLPRMQLECWRILDRLLTSGSQTGGSV
ncbi:MAG: AGE family epimerase/isomerase [Planctomycetaceae bacterium]